MNERDAAERILIAIYNEKPSLTILTWEIKKVCANDHVKFPIVITLLNRYLTPLDSGFGGDAHNSYRLNECGVLFVQKGCWSGIEKTEYDILKKENIEKDDKIKRMQKEKSKDRRVTILATIVGAIVGALITVIAGHLIK